MDISNVKDSKDKSFSLAFPVIRNVKSKHGYTNNVVLTDGVLMTQRYDNQLVTMVSNYV